VLSEIWGRLLEIDHSTSVLEWVIWQRFGSTESNALIGVEGTGEVVAIVDVENAVIKVNVNADIQVFPGVGFNRARLGNEVTLKENSLGNSGVRDTGLQNVDSVVLQVVIHSALTEAVVLVLVLNNSLLEVDGEVQNLYHVRV
jgi:hypothetical protein